MNYLRNSLPLIAITAALSPALAFSQTLTHIVPESSRYSVPGLTNRAVDCVVINRNPTPGTFVLTKGQSTGAFYPADSAAALIRDLRRHVPVAERAAVSVRLTDAVRRLNVHEKACERGFKEAANALPLASSVTPKSAAPGKAITIKGKNLHKVTSIMMGTAVISQFESQTAKAISFIPPAGTESGKLSLVYAKGIVTSTLIARVSGAAAPTKSTSVKIPIGQLDSNQDGGRTWFDAHMIESALGTNNPHYDLDRNNIVDERDLAIQIGFLDAYQWTRWHNAAQPLDVDGNGTQNDADRLLVEAALFEFPTGEISSDFMPPGFIDVNADNLITVSDLSAFPEPELEPLRDEFHCRNPQKPGDVNGDGLTTPIDMLLIINYGNAGQYGALKADCTEAPWYDVNDDGIVDREDADAVFDAPPPTRRDAFCQNRKNRLDVNNDGKITAFDALTIINLGNTGGFGPLAESCTGAPFLDVNGDHRISKSDAQAVIDWLNSGGTPGSL